MTLDWQQWSMCVRARILDARTWTDREERRMAFNLPINVSHFEYYNP